MSRDKLAAKVGFPVGFATEQQRITFWQDKFKVLLIFLCCTDVYFWFLFMVYFIFKLVASVYKLDQTCAYFQDYGKTFTNVSSQLVVNQTKTAVISNYYASRSFNSYVSVAIGYRWFFS